MVMRHKLMDMPPVGYGGTAFGRLALLRALNEWKDGAGEIGGNNRGKYVAKYLNSFAAEGNSWCAGFVSWCYSNEGNTIPFQYSVSALGIRNTFRKNGWLIYDDPKAEYFDLKVFPRPGNIIVFERGTRVDALGHIGLVYHRDGNVLHTIEGNRNVKGEPLQRVQGFSYDLTQKLDIIAIGEVPDTAELFPIVKKVG